MTNTRIPETAKLSDSEMQRLSRSTRYKPRAMVMAVLSGAFFMGPVAYFIIVASGVLNQPNPPPRGFPIWAALGFIVLVQIPVQVIVVSRILKEARTESVDFDEACGRSLTALIVALAFGESSCIYGLVSVVLQAPKSFAYGLMTLGVVHLIVTVAVLWPRLKTLMLTRLAAEEGGTSGGW